jgi:hypothetical protein
VKWQCKRARIDRNKAWSDRDFGKHRGCESNAVAIDLVADDRTASTIARTHQNLSRTARQSCCSAVATRQNLSACAGKDSATAHLKRAWGVSVEYCAGEISAARCYSNSRRNPEKSLAMPFPAKSLVTHFSKRALAARLAPHGTLYAWGFDQLLLNFER